MTKTLLFSIGSVLIMAVVVCWVTGVLPRGGRTGAGVTLAGKKTVVAATSGNGVTAAVSEDGLSVYFSPNGGCTDALVKAISEAKTTVFVQAAQFTSVPVARALVEANKRGVDVRVVVDRKKDDTEKSQVDRLVAANVPVFADGRHHTAHNKVIMIDHRLMFTGSFNFTRESEAENAENLLKIEGKPQLIAAYEANFKTHLEHSNAFEK
jgi:phosphatidylserine/phosphatidylglycerophosphate/cardiolipin synthase-like enzyme